MLTAAVVSADTVSSGYLRACLQQTGLVRSVIEWNHDKCELSPGDSPPDSILLDLPREAAPLLAFAAQLRRQYPNAQIIACSGSSHTDPEFLLQAMRSGVQELLSKPVDPHILQEILSRLLQEARPNGAMTKKTIVVIGSKGGVGTSTVAVNLGVQISILTRKRVVLLDLARPVGHVSLLLDLAPRFTIRDAVENIDRLDGHFFGGLLTPHKSGLEVLGGIAQPGEWELVPISALTRIVNVTQAIADFVLVDAGCQWNEEWNSVFRLARMVLVVAESNVPSLWTLERQLSCGAALGLQSEQVRIVINRWMQSDEPILKSVEKTVKRAIFARLPNDFAQVSEAISLGVPLSRNHHNPLVSEFRSLAGRLAGVNQGAAPRHKALNPFFRTVK